MLLKKPKQMLWLIIFASMALAASARAEMLVLESTLPQFKVGDHIADDAIGTLAAGQRVKVLLLPSNTTKVFEGNAGGAKGVDNLPFGGTRGLKRKATQSQ